MGNIATAFAAVATAADLSLTSGVRTAISAALSGTELFKQGTHEQKNMAQEMASLLESHLAATPHLTDDRRKIVTQMLAMFPPSQVDLAEGNMQADTIVANMCDRIKASQTAPEHKADTALDDYKTLLTRLLAPFLEPASQHDANSHVLLQRSADIRATVRDTNATVRDNKAMMAKMQEMLEKSGEADRLRQAGITERAIIDLARRRTSNTEDLGSAWLTLQDAVDIAVRMQQEARASSNHGDFVDEVLSRVAALSRDGNYADAGNAITDALAENAAARDRLLTWGIDVARLEGNAARAAELLVQQADAQSGGRADGQAIHHLQQGFYERGYDKGIALDLEIAIALGRVCVDRAMNQDDRGAALNTLGIALQALGERENGIDRLEAAVTAFENALGEWTRDRAPLQWAGAQNNLGSALQTLGERENRTDRLEAAVTAFENVLGEWTRDRVPLQWAGAQMNLGNALSRLGKRENGTDRLEAAVTAYKNALGKWTRDRVPLQWATAQMNLGNALSRLGERENRTDRLKAAVTAFENALKERTRDRVPLQWATTQNNLGTALQALGERENGTDRLEAAVTAFENALKEFTRDRVPLDWARAQMNLGTALQALGERENNTDRLGAAVTAYENALEVFTRDRVPFDWAGTQMNLAILHCVFFDKTGDPAHLDTATEHALAARAVFEEARASHYLTTINNILAGIEERRG